MIRIGNISALPWKAAAGGFGILTLIFGVMLVVASITNSDLRTQLKHFRDLIEDPKTGYVVRLARSESNTATLTVQIQQQNAAVEEMSRASAEALAATNRRLTLESSRRRKAEAHAAVLLAQRPRGSTLEARIIDVDNRVLETLK